MQKKTLKDMVTVVLSTIVLAAPGRSAAQQHHHQKVIDMETFGECLSSMFD